MILIIVIISLAYLTLLERKLLAIGQRRIGPNIIGYYGILQPLIDGIKLILKESIIKNIYLFIGPIILLFFTFALWLVIPLPYTFYEIKLDFLYIIALSSLTIYGILLGSYFSFSKFSFISTLRSISQLISYEIALGISLLPFIIINQSLNLYDINNNWFNYFSINIIFLFISFLAETNRTPFDLLEAESELVAGYLTEYSSIIFVFYYIGEYAMIIFWSFILQILSYISWIFFSILFILIRGILPRFKYNQLIILGWYYLIPLSLTSFLFHVISFYY